MAEKNIPEKKCVHSFQLLATRIKTTVSDGGYQYISRVDEFYCIKCLHIETKTKGKGVNTRYDGVPEWAYPKE